MTNLAIDHVALIVAADRFDQTAASLDAAGLAESCRGAHPGQGTKNIFYCFDNAFIELLTVIDPAEAASPAVQRLGLGGRSMSVTNGATPIGLALRVTDPATVLPFATWDYLPPGSTNLRPTVVSSDSDDLRQPLVFRAQRTAPPAEWTDGRAGQRQQRAGLSVIQSIRLTLPDAPSPTLLALAALGLIQLDPQRGPAQVLLALAGDAGRREICFPGSGE